MAEQRNESRSLPSNAEFASYLRNLASMMVADENTLTITAGSAKTFSWALIQAASRLEKSSEIRAWIPVTERLPAEGERVMIFHASDKTLNFGWLNIDRRYKDQNHWTGENCGYDGAPGDTYGVTHWMLLPEDPK